MIKKITYLETFPVRHLVLREGKPIESCYFSGDELKTTIHLGLFVENKLIGVASVFKINSNKFLTNNQFQLRGMAVLKEYSGKGYGSVLLNEVVKIVVENKSDLLWFNARENAVPFYKKHGFKIEGNIFEIENIGAHYIMFKHFVG